jgi:signal recognition particle subunit SRP54
MKNMAGMGLRDRFRAMSQMADSGMMNPGASLSTQKLRSKRGMVDKEKELEKKKRQRKEAKKQRKKNRR